MAFITVYLFLLQSILLMSISEADPLLDVNPSEIVLGITSTLEINCTFSLNNHPDLAALISLVLSRANSTGQDFQELAAITEFSPNAAQLLTQEDVLASGVNNQTGESFLNVIWKYPTTLQAGVYQCSALGVDNVGHNVELPTDTSSVTVDEANVNDLFEELREIKMHESSMENTISAMENQIQDLENNRLSMEQEIQTLQNNKTAMAQSISDLESAVTFLQKRCCFFLGEHRGHFYYISRHDAGDVNYAIDACKAIGAELATINNEDEYTAIKNLLDGNTDIKYVQIDGSDEDSEGNWVLSNSSIPLPYTAWRSGSPSNDRTYNCLILDEDNSWLMNDATCHETPTDGWRYMCEQSSV